VISAIPFTLSLPSHTRLVRMRLHAVDFLLGLTKRRIVMSMRDAAWASAEAFPTGERSISPPSLSAHLLTTSSSRITQDSRLRRAPTTFPLYPRARRLTRLTPARVILVVAVGRTHCFTAPATIITLEGGPRDTLNFPSLSGCPEHGFKTVLTYPARTPCIPDLLRRFVPHEV
jgi:hypothetical protein